MSLVWTDRPPVKRQAVGGLVVQPQWRTPSIEEARTPRWFAPLTLVFILAFVGGGAWTVIKALDHALAVASWCGR